MHYDQLHFSWCFSKINGAFIYIFFQTRGCLKNFRNLINFLTDVSSPFLHKSRSSRKLS
uniref:Uncharacterized protein n=1 Tax=Solanum lycopersicum TaxID=4081 RepID=A0A3Q7I1K7_SOLLC